MNQQGVDCCKKFSKKNKYFFDFTFTNFHLSKNVDNNKCWPKLLFFYEKTSEIFKWFFYDLCKKKSIMSKNDFLSPRYPHSGFYIHISQFFSFLSDSWVNFFHFCLTVGLSCPKPQFHYITHN